MAKTTWWETRWLLFDDGEPIGWVEKKYRGKRTWAACVEAGAMAAPGNEADGIEPGDVAREYTKAEAMRELEAWWAKHKAKH